MVKLVGTAFRDVNFKECKMFGLQFNDCNEFGQSFRFEGCSLNNSVFYQTSLKKTLFKDSKLIEVDFTECNLQIRSLIIVTFPEPFLIILTWKNQN